jgi:hypothetical protein
MVGDFFGSVECIVSLGGGEVGETSVGTMSMSAGRKWLIYSPSISQVIATQSLSEGCAVQGVHVVLAFANNGALPVDKHTIRTARNIRDVDLQG